MALDESTALATRNKLILLAAGGTGGHLFPAEALAVVLGKRGLTVDLATDHRAAHFKFPARAVHLIPSATLRGRNPLALARTAALLALGSAQAWRLIGKIRPGIVVGFGGYPTVPPLLAARWRGVPSVLHEQNGVMGRANRLLAPRVTAIATSFPTLARVDPQLQPKITFTGNPVRAQVIEAARALYAAPDAGGKIRLLVFGGSQGAHVMAEIVPAAIALLEPALRARLSIVQQARGEDLEAVRAAYGKLGVAAETAAFFADLPARMAAAHLVISRSGASTVAELSAIGRPYWCRCRMRWIRTSSPMPVCWRRRAGRSGSRSVTSPRNAWLPRSSGWPAMPRCWRAWRARPNRPAPSTPPSGWRIW